MNKLASHNTMSYLTPTKWWMKLFKCIYKCQDLTIDEQYKLGVRVFDFRVTYYKDKLIFAHGIIKFEHIDIYKLLDKINKWGDCSIRIVLEENKQNDNTFVYSKWFVHDVRAFITKFPNIKFFEGTRKYDWNILVPDIFLNNPDYVQRISSMNGNIFTRFFPRLYAKLNNKRNISKHYVRNQYLFIDFIGKYY